MSPTEGSIFEVLASAPALIPSREWQTAARHGLSASLAQRLADAGLPVPAEAISSVRQAVASGVGLARLTRKTLGALAAVGVCPILLKGYGLALRLMPAHPFSRPSVDVDLLVHPHELPTVTRALTERGFSQFQDPGLADPLEEHHHLSFEGPEGLVEIHFRAFIGFGGRTFDDGGLWARSRPFDLDGLPARLLSPEDEFVFLATHAAHHAFLRISWLVDLQRYLMVEPSLDWQVMASRARAAGFHTAVAVALHLVAARLKVTLPQGADVAFPLARRRRLLVDRLFSADRLASAEWSSDKDRSVLLRLVLVDDLGQVSHELLHGVVRRLRRAGATS